MKQLGNSHDVFPGAKHTRFEHSLGVMHLSGKFLDTLRMKRPGCATKVDRLVEVTDCTDTGRTSTLAFYSQYSRDNLVPTSAMPAAGAVTIGAKSCKLQVARTKHRSVKFLEVAALTEVKNDALVPTAYLAHSQGGDSLCRSDSAWGARGQIGHSTDSDNGPGGDYIHDVTRTQDAALLDRRRVSQGSHPCSNRGDRGSSHVTRILDDVATVDNVEKRG